jgi:uncharacterized protein involved in outer membrane biogenesis
MRAMRKILIGLVVLVVAAVGVVYWLLSDANRFRGEIAAHQENTASVEIKGDSLATSQATSSPRTSRPVDRTSG